MKKEMTRELWLQQMAGHLSIRFLMCGWSFGDKKYSVSCGLPSEAAFSRKMRAVGECWYPEVSTGGIHEIFISPTIDDPIEASSILAHELVHVVVGKECGHRRKFKECAKSIGLIGRMTDTELGYQLQKYIQEGIKSLNLGRYPHWRMVHTKTRKQGVRTIKIECTNIECEFFIKYNRGYNLRASRLVLDEGLPPCGVCRGVMKVHENKTNKSYM